MSTQMKEELTQIKKDFMQNLKDWENKYGLAVNEIEIHRTGVSDSQCDTIQNIYTGFRFKCVR